MVPKKCNVVYYALRTFGCVGVYRPEITIVDYVAVYWAGSTLGALAAWLATPAAKRAAKAAVRVANLCASRLCRTKNRRAAAEDSIPLVRPMSAGGCQQNDEASFFIIGGGEEGEEGVVGDAADDEISNVTEDSHEHKL